MADIAKPKFVYANAGDPLALVQWGPTGGSVTLNRGEIWYADDPFVLDRPDLFSSTPVIAHSTDNREHPAPTPLGEARKRRGGRRG